MVVLAAREPVQACESHAPSVTIIIIVVRPFIIFDICINGCVETVNRKKEKKNENDKKMYIVY